VVAVDPAADGFTTVWPCGQPQPGTSTINFHAGTTRANLALIDVGEGGRICVASSASTDLVVDVFGSFATDGSFRRIVPERLADTRTGAQPSAHQVVEVDAPTGAVAVALNVAVTRSSAAGFVTVWPCGGARPATSSVNYVAGTTVANAVLTAVGTNGKVCLATSAPADIVVDLTGVFTGDAAYRPLAPERLLDTR
jgi:autotransporter family porin